jgi:hypothetical protein
VFILKNNDHRYVVYINKQRANEAMMMANEAMIDK